MACAKRYNVGCSKRMGLFQGRQNGPKHQKKKKNSANHRSWSRESGGRVTTGPIQRVNVPPGLTSTAASVGAGLLPLPPPDAITDSPSETDTTDTQSSGAPSQADPEPTPELLPPASNSVAGNPQLLVALGEGVKDESAGGHQAPPPPPQAQPPQPPPPPPVPANVSF